MFTVIMNIAPFNLKIRLTLVIRCAANKNRLQSNINKVNDIQPNDGAFLKSAEMIDFTGM